ncbi:cyclin-dependent kinase G-1-like protein [Corchorus olitorius]|uniref:Cyclin-dependent kinase G-1-like protein n=1 Tax=Corchorus olitorius TaxID=93759 RepID=A0A1R3L4S8_9ROSI|nr:cyclin-dependent kinase G-1-like protein [Corchorus olitorius]
MTPEIPPKKNPPVKLAHPSAVCSGSGTFFRPVKVKEEAVEGSPSLNDATPYIVKQMLNMTTKPAAAKLPAPPATGVFLKGPAFTNGPTRRNPWANPTSTPLKSGLTAVL